MSEAKLMVTKRGHNIIQILVIANFLPAVISLLGSSTVTEGNYVEFKCTLSVTLQTLGECQLIQSYLQRDEAILQVGAFNVTQRKTTFVIQGAVTRDSGHYSCVVLPSKCIQEQQKMIHGENKVELQVTGGLFLRLVVIGVAITLLVLLGVLLGFWCIIKQGFLTAWCVPSAGSQQQQADSDMLEEQQEQADAEDLETQDDSFGEEEEDYENQNYHSHVVPVDEDNLNLSDPDGLYSTVEEKGRAMCTYATSIRKKKRQP
ncbi:uncharacterized protein LOC110000228 [Xyrichtys novacula]|uniref:Uncharacterized protein LOC110000228 n=1 Tax=Xyrichtys novacula TaxID=13765 RepID=A0AAV1EJZ4_XYRNO|nr:uncharacterized protein LOC110000228 [Xyrichtys novacula]